MKYDTGDTSRQRNRKRKARLAERSSRTARSHEARSMRPARNGQRIRSAFTPSMVAARAGGEPPIGSQAAPAAASSA